MKFLFLLIPLLFSEVAFTSKEGLLATASFQMESEGIGSSGPVLVKGKRGADGRFESLSVEAFGKKLAVDKKLLEKIPALSNGVQLTFEQGYERLGGRTIYLIFLKGFTSGSTEKAVLAVKENGKSEWSP